MPITLGSLRVILATNIAQFKSDLASGAGAVAQFGAGVRANMGTISAVAGTATAAVGALGAGVVLLGRRGSEIGSIEASFRQLTDAVGQSGDAMLGITRDATRNLISDLEIMEAANKGLLLGLPLTEGSMGELAAAARVLGAAMGQDATKSLDDLITALGRSSPLILDNLGLTVRLGEANSAYAAELGKPASALTEAEKKQAFYNAAMDAARAKVEQLGGQQLTFGERVTQATVAVQNITNSLSIAIARSPAINAGFDAIASAITRAFGDDQERAVATMVGLIDRAAIAVVGLGKVGVGAIQLFTRAWSGLMGVVSSVTTNMVRSIQLVLKSLAAMAKAGSVIPGLGNQFQAMGSRLEGMAIQTAGAAAEFESYRDESLQAARGSSDFQDILTNIQVELSGTVDEMQRASQEQSMLASATSETGRVIQTVTSHTDAMATSTAAATAQTREAMLAQFRLQTTLRDLSTRIKQIAFEDLPAVHAGTLRAQGGFIDLTGDLNASATPAVSGMSLELGKLPRVMTNVTDTLDQLFIPGIGGGLLTAKGKFEDFVGEDGVKGILSGFFSESGSGTLNGIVMGGLNLLLGGLPGLLSSLAELFQGFIRTVGSWFSGLFKSIGRGLRNIFTLRFAPRGAPTRAGHPTAPISVPEADPDVSLPSAQQGGIVTRPTIAALHAPEAIVPLNRAGGFSTIGIERRLEELVELVRQQPDDMAVTMRAALARSV